MDWYEPLDFPLPSDPFYTAESFFEPGLEGLLAANAVPTPQEAAGVSTGSVNGGDLVDIFEMEPGSAHDNYIDCDMDELEQMLNDNTGSFGSPQPSPTAEDALVKSLLNDLADIASDTDIQTAALRSSAMDTGDTSGFYLSQEVKPCPGNLAALSPLDCGAVNVSEEINGGTDSGFCSPSTFSECHSPLDPNVAIKEELSPELILADLEKDLAMFEQSVNSVCGDEPLLGDMFPEESSSDMPTEYNNLLENLLKLPVDDFDIAMHMFSDEPAPGNPDGLDLDEPLVKNEEEEPELPVDELRRHIQMDHDYCLPPSNNPGTFEVPVLSVINGVVTDDVGVFVKKEPVPDIKSVNLISHNDLNTIFSDKFKDKFVTKSTTRQFTFVPNSLNNNRSSTNGRSLLKKNAVHSSQSNSRIISLKTSHKLVQKLHLKAKPEDLETAMAVQTLLGEPNLGLPTSGNKPDKEAKMQADREMHNSMERQRRIELRHEFDALKKVVPEIANTEKVSKLNVLNSATKYVQRLQKAEKKVVLKLEFQKMKRKQLLDVLNSLATNTG